MALAMVYFGCWIGALLLIKNLILAEYQIQVRDLSKAIVGALVLSKVVILLERVPLGSWISRRPAWVDILARTALYGAGVMVIMLIEKGFDGRHEYGGFGESLMAVFRHADIHHIWVNTIGLGGALLIFNAAAAVRRHLDHQSLLKVLTSPLPPDAGECETPSGRTIAVE